MRYFVSYSEVFGNKDTIKRESLRLQTYNMLVKFLTRKNIENNPICEEFASLKAYLESRDFTSIYFLSPYILNENQFVKDMIEVISTSGETNSFNKIRSTLEDEMKTISAGRQMLTSRRYIARTADEYLDKYFADPSSANILELSDPEEQEVLLANMKDGYNRGEAKLSTLYLRHLLSLSKTQSDVEEIINMGLSLLNSHKDNVYITYFLAEAYNHQLYQKSDKYEKFYFWCQKASLLNSSRAMCEAGLCCFWGLGRQKNVRQALEYWSKAAKMNNDDASSLLGIYYLSKGQKEKAKPYLLASAARGDYKALLLLDTDFDRK
jgi:tetratricopeptide (TPR) repeat protein